MGIWSTLRRLAGGPRALESTPGSLAELESYIGRLVKSPRGTGVLVVQAQGAEAFIQFTGGPEGVEMDFPLVTPFQKAREQRIRSFCDQHHLHVRVSFGSDGNAFLDVDLPPDPAAISATVRSAFAEIFALHEPLAVEYMHEGLKDTD